MMRDTLLGLLAAGDTGRWDTGVLAREVTALAVTPDERARARDALLALLTVGGHPRVAAAVADVACTLNPPAAERGQAREALLSLLATEDDESRARQLAPAIAKLAPTTTERDQARAGLLALLAREGRDGHAWALARTIAELRPTAAELDRSGSWPFPPCQTWPTWGLLTPARRNSDLRAWLKTLPHLGSS